MPTYEYACSSCRHEWEFEQSIKDNALTECPTCHQQTARRQISRGTGFILKGGGWYADLYSSSGNKTAADTKSTGGSTATTTTTADAKPSGGSSGSSGSDGGSSGSSGPAPSAPSGGSASSASAA